MSIGLSIKILGTVVELFLPFILTYILDNVIVSARVERVVFFGVIMIMCAGVAAFCNITANRMAARVSADISNNIRQDLFDRILYLSAKDIDKYTIPSLESRITTDTYNVHNFISMMQRMGVRAPIMLVGGIIITMIMDPMLSLVMLAMIPVIFLFVYFMSKKGIPLYAKVQKSVDGMVRIVREDVQGMRVIKALSKGEYENQRYDKVNAKLSKDERKAGMVMGTVNPFMTLLMNLGITAVVAISARLVSNGQSTAPTVIAFMQYFTYISMALMAISRIFTGFTKSAASADRIDEVIQTPEHFFVKKSEKRDTDAYISFKNVSFSYFGKKDDLKNISFSLKRGEKLGIIGATGSGKSTLIKLLMRFYEPRCGEIEIDGKSVSSYTRKELSAFFGAAMQNDFLYADTISENIKLGRSLTEEEVVAAAKTAQAHEFISSLNDTYAHMLSQKGTNLSGGQRQRILISRALAARPPILILDDSSSALDYKTDANLRQAISKDLSDSTVITVAQRVSSVMGSDLILVLDEGKIIGKGSHQELLESCPEYKEISDSQMGGAFVE